MRDGFLFYAFWNGEQMRDLFEALAHITSLSGYSLLAQCAVLLGFLLVMTAGAVRHQGRPVITYFACAVLFWFVAIVPRVTVVIEDVRSHSVYVVDHIPLSIGVFGSWTSQIGHFLTQSYETAFTPVASTQYSQFGAVFPQRILEALQAVGPVTTQGQAELQAVTTGCLVPEMIAHPRKAREVAQSSDLWGLITSAGWVNPARMTAFPDGAVRYCPQALQLLDQTLQTIEMPALKNILGARFAPGQVDPGSILATSVMESESLLLGLSRTMDESLRHSLLLTAIPQAIEASSAENNAPLASAVGLAKAQGSLAAEINYRTMAKIAEESLPKMRNAIEFLLIAMFPVVSLLALASGQAMGVLLRTYFVLLFSIELWPALASVINYLHIAVDAHPFSALAQTFGGNSLQAAALIRETGASSQAISGWLMISVPFIAFAIVKGGDIALTQLTSGLTQPAQSAATSQGTSLAAGNVTQGSISLGNVSQHNISSHKMDASARTAEAGMWTAQSAFGSVTRSAEGQVTAASRTAIDLGVAATSSQTWGRARNLQHAISTSLDWTEASNFSISKAAASGNATQQSFAQALREALTSTNQAATSYTQQTSSTSSLGSLESTSLSSAQEMRETQVLSSAAGLGLGKRPMSETESYVPGLSHTAGAPIASSFTERVSADSSVATSPQESTPRRFTAGPSMRLQAGVDLRNMQAQSLIDQATGRKETRTSLEELQARSRVQAAAEQIASTHADEDVRQAAREFRQSLTESRTAQQTDQRSFSTQVVGSSTLGEQKSAAIAASVNQDVELLHAAIDRFGSPEAALRALHASASRSQLAEQSFSSSKTRAHPHDAFGPGTMERVIERNTPLRDRGQAMVRQFDQTARASTMIEDSNNSPFDLTEHTSHRKEAQSAIAAQRILQEENLSAQHQDLALERGALLAASAVWREKNADGSHSLWKNAFLGGIGYQSGDDLHLRIKEAAVGNDKFAAVLREWGQSKESHTPPADWKMLHQTLK